MFDSSLPRHHERSDADVPGPGARCTGSAELITGSVVHAWLELDHGGKWALIGAGAGPVSTAASCLLRPQPGDRVRAVADQETWYITAVLSRPALHAPFQLDTGGRELAIAAHRFSLRTNIMDVRANSSFREITATDVTRARHIVQQAEGTLVMRGKSAALSADGLLRVDGAQVHMG